MKRTLSGFLAAVLAGGVIALLFQHQTRALLQDEISSLRRQNREIERLQRENRRLLGSLAPADEFNRLRNDQKELPRLWEELITLTNRIRAQSGPRSVPDASQPPKPLAPGMIRLEDLPNAGSGSPTAAAQTFFWTVAQADPDAMAKQLVLGDAARTKAEALLSSLDPTTREKMSTPEKLMAFYMVGLLGRVAGIQLLGQEDQGTDRASWNVRLQMASGRFKNFGLPVWRSADGCHEEVPAGMVDQWSTYLLRSAPKT